MAKYDAFFANVTTPAEARSVYRKLIKVTHPNKGGSDANFQKLQNAYANAVKRLTLTVVPVTPNKPGKAKARAGPSSSNNKKRNNTNAWFNFNNENNWASDKASTSSRNNTNAWFNFNNENNWAFDKASTSSRNNGRRSPPPPISEIHHGPIHNFTAPAPAPAPRPKRRVGVSLKTAAKALGIGAIGGIVAGAGGSVFYPQQTLRAHNLMKYDLWLNGTRDLCLSKGPGSRECMYERSRHPNWAPTTAKFQNQVLNNMGLHTWNNLESFTVQKEVNKRQPSSQTLWSPTYKKILRAGRIAKEYLQRKPKEPTWGPRVAQQSPFLRFLTNNPNYVTTQKSYDALLEKYGFKDHLIKAFRFMLSPRANDKKIYSDAEKELLYTYTTQRKTMGSSLFPSEERKELEMAYKVALDALNRMKKFTNTKK